METVYDFTLPKGYLDSTGQLHKKGKMRLATAGDEISATRDPRVLSNPSYLTIVILGKVVTELEGVEMVTACPDCGKIFQVPLNFTREG